MLQRFSCGEIWYLKFLTCEFFVLPLDETALYSRAHCADCEFCLAGHDVGGLDVAVIHGVLERSSPIRVLVAHVTIEGDFGSSSGKTESHYNQAGVLECTILLTVVGMDMQENYSKKKKRFFFFF